MKRILLSIAILLAPALASADVVSVPQVRRVIFGSDGLPTKVSASKVLNAVALNAAAASRTFVLTVAGLSKVTIQVDLTRDAATDLSLTCSVSLNGGSSYAQLHSTSVAAGVGTMSAYSDVKAGTASVNVPFEYDVRTYDKIRCTVAGTSGGAADLVTVYAIGAVGQ
jgi:hypothetical protein